MTARTDIESTRLPGGRAPGGRARAGRAPGDRVGGDQVRGDRVRGDRGSASVEQTGLMLFVALIFVSLTGLLLLHDDPAGRGVGERVANRIACGPRAPDACSHHPTVTAYGWPVARLLRYFAPEPMARPGPDGSPLVPVDFRYCRHSTCAVPAPGSGDIRLTTSNRRVTAFTEVRGGSSDGGGMGSGDEAGSEGGELELVYWLYRPGLGWEDLHRHATRADVEAASGTRVLLEDSPLLVPLETLDGRNHIDFPDHETPPWQWRVKSDYRDPESAG